MMNHYLKKIKDLVLQTIGHEDVGVYLCGKWATDNPSIDDAIEIVVDADPNIGSCLIIKLSERLEESHIPFQVNVIDLNRSPFGLRRDSLKKKIVWKKVSRINPITIWKQSLDLLHEALHENLNPFIRDTVIYRFEISFDLCYRSVVYYSKEKLGIVSQTQRGYFRDLLKAGLVSPDETELFLEMVDVRNRNADCYDESYLFTTYEKITSQYFPLMKLLAEKIALP